tara:strand:- start:115534 stop:116160 length:627 start_codon:yes stop_codon:yes gene_type:complete
MRTLLITLAGIAAGFALPHGDPTQEPPLHFDVQIDGTTHQAAEGKKTSIKIGDIEHQLTVAVSPLRHFAAAGLQFDYPRDAIFEYELDEGTESWTIETNNLVFMIHRFEDGGAQMMAKLMIGATLSALDSEVKAKPRTIEFGGKTYKGAGAVAAVGDVGIDITMVGMTIDGKAIVITVQNTLGDDSKFASDSVAATAMIQKTFRIAGK